jgi:hypothetical protein
VVSIVKNDRVSSGISLNPEFNVAQHENGINILYSFKALFENSGNVFQKSGSEKVLVYSLKGTQNIKKYVLPFYSKYIVEYSSKYKSEMFESYCYIIDKLDSNKKRTMEKEILIELVKLLYLFNPDGKGKQRKRTLEEVLEIINGKR